MSILINNRSTLFKHGSKHRNSGYKPFLFNYPSSLSSSFSPLPLTMTLLFNDLIQYLPPSIHNLSINDPRTYEWYLVSRLIASPGRSFDVESTACRSIISACTRSLTKSGGKLCLHAVTWVIGIVEYQDVSSNGNIFMRYAYNIVYIYIEYVMGKAASLM